MSRNGLARRFPIVFSLVVVLGALESRSHANCPSAPILHGLTSSFESCGPNAAAFFWGHGRAVQSTIAYDDNAATASIAGHDSGILQTLSDGMFIDGPNGGAANGSYLGNTEGALGGSDGCFLNLILSDTFLPTCRGGPDFGVVDYVIAGVDPSQPNIARMAAVSVDFNQFFGQHVLDNAGAPAVDGDPCGGDAFSGYPVPAACAPIPAPEILGVTPVPGGSSVNLGFGDVSGILILDDCAVAESRAVNCPRNLYAGRILLFKRGACSPSAADAFDRRVFIFPPQLPPSPTFQTITPNWLTFSREDGNLNGVLDAGEDGSNGGAANGRLDPFIVPGTATTNATVTLPVLAGATDCVFFAMTLALDANHLPVNPPTNTIFGETVLAPMVSVNPTPVVPGGASPTDQVVSIVATKVGGDTNVEWTTEKEMFTDGFNLIGAKKGSQEVVLNRSLIPAQEGTTGNGATYSFAVDRNRLKGSALLFVEVVKLDGSRVRFGPASF